MLQPNEIGILYVDDEEMSLKYFKEMFEDLGPIFTARNGDEGVRIFRENQDQIGIVLSDKNMPGMNGLELLEKIRKIDDAPLRMLVTAHTDLNQAVDALNDGLLYSYLTKPWSPEELHARLKRSIDRFWIMRERSNLLKNRASVYRELMMAEKANSIETLSLGLNHHMKNALTVVQAYFDMIPFQLKQELGAEPKDHFFWREYYGNVEEQIGRMVSILTSLTEGLGIKNLNESSLKFSKDLNVAEIAEEVGRAETRAESNLQFLVKGDTDVTVKADEAKLLRLFSGLIQEAKQNIGDQEGIIEIRLSRTLLADVISGVGIECSDTGPAIPDDERNKLFDPFSVRANRPSDIGISLLACYFITFQHGGAIRAEGRAGKNVIQVVLPLEPRQPKDLSQSRKIMDKLS